MSTIITTDVVAGDYVKATDHNNNVNAIKNECNGLLNRANVQTRWHRQTVTRHFYTQAAAGTTANRLIDIPAPVGGWPDVSDVRYVGLSFNRSASGVNAREIRIRRYVLATGADADLLDTVAVPTATTHATLDGTATAIIPATHGLRVYYDVTGVGDTYAVDEFCEIDVYIAFELAAVTEL